MNRTMESLLLDHMNKQATDWHRIGFVAAPTFAHDDDLLAAISGEPSDRVRHLRRQTNQTKLARARTNDTHLAYPD